MALSDELAEAGVEKQRIETARLRRERDAATAENLRLVEQIENLQRTLEVVEQVESAQITRVEWLTPKKPSSKSAATLVLMLSDLHLDEVVLPQEVDALNAYNREIAKLRLRKTIENTIKISRHYLAGMKYDGCVLLLGGDIFSGDIHEELAETNEDTMLGSLLYWASEIGAALDLLAEEFRKVHVAAVAGNHGRMSRKPRMKLRAKTNFDWLLAKMLERHFANDKRITFDVPESSDVLVSIYDSHHLLTHGDQAHGGSGIGGIYPPIMRLRARKAQRYLSTGLSFDTLWLGHWHQYLPSPSLIVNGSMKGLDEYAFVNNFGYEPPQQALAVVVPEKGITLQAPIFCVDRKREKW